MKLRNLLYATMVACAFASCSKDDTEIVGPDGPDAEANATLEVKIVNPATKAMPAAGDDAEIKSLALVVFNGTGGTAVETVGSTAGSTESIATSVKTGSIKPGMKDILVLANLTTAEIATLSGKTKAEVLAMTRTLSAETADNGFSMNSGIMNVSVGASGTTYVGYEAIPTGAVDGSTLQSKAAPVKLYRNVAKIKINKVNKGEINGSQYPGAAIEIKQVFILHGHNKTTLVGEGAAEWGATTWATAAANKATVNYMNGATSGESGEYAGWVKYMKDGKFNKVYNFIENADLYATMAEGDYVRTMAAATITSEDAVAPFYTYESTEAVDGYRTLLVVQADFSYTGKDETGTSKTIIEEGRFYPIAVGYSGTTVKDNLSAYKGLRGAGADATIDVAGVLRNLEYSVNLTITGPGYETPFGPKPDGGDPEHPGEGGDTFMDAKVVVVPFGTVTQDDTIE